MVTLVAASCFGQAPGASSEWSALCEADLRTDRLVEFQTEKVPGFLRFAR